MLQILRSITLIFLVLPAWSNQPVDFNSVAQEYERQNQELLAMAKAHEGKFVVELVEQRHLPKTKTVHVPNIYMLGDYDAQRQMFVSRDIFSQMKKFTVWSNEKPAGSFVGQNAFNVRVEVQKIKGERLNIFNVGSYKFSDIEIPMSISEYQEYQRKGFSALVSFEVGQGLRLTDQVFEKRRIFEEATIQKPIQTNVDEYVISGEITSVALYSPNGRLLVGSLPRRFQ